MPTSYDVLFDSFLAKIEDDLYSIIPEADLRRELTSFLNASIPRFRYPNIDIRAKDDVTQTFEADLDYDEIEILANLMKARWIEQKLNSIHNIRQKYTERDFQLTSQANHLKTLMELQKMTDKIIHNLQVDYSKKIDGKLDFSGLSGKGDTTE